MTVPRRGGRPALDEGRPTVQVQVRLPSAAFDALCAQALREGVSVPEMLRQALRAQQEPPKKT